MKLINRHTESVKESTYIGRGTPLGNPFSTQEGLSRPEALKKFERHLDHAIIRRDPAIMHALGCLHEDSVLACSCLPKACHGEIIIDKLKTLNITHQRSPYYTLILSEESFLKSADDRKSSDVVIMSKIIKRLFLRGYTCRVAVGAQNSLINEFCANSVEEQGAIGEFYASPEGFNSRWLFNHIEQSNEMVDFVNKSFPYSQNKSKLERWDLALKAQSLLGDQGVEPSDFIVCIGKSMQTRDELTIAEGFKIPVFTLSPDIQCCEKTFSEMARHIDSNPQIIN